jgi:hypothetical protein
VLSHWNRIFLHPSAGTVQAHIHTTFRCHIVCSAALERLSVGVALVETIMRTEWRQCTPRAAVRDGRISINWAEVGPPWRDARPHLIIEHALQHLQFARVLRSGAQRRAGHHRPHYICASTLPPVSLPTLLLLLVLVRRLCGLLHGLLQS